MLVSVLRSSLRIRLHVQVPSVQLDDVSVLDVREDLCYRFISVTLRGHQQDLNMTSLLIHTVRSNY